MSTSNSTLRNLRKTQKPESLRAQRSNLHVKIQPLKDCFVAALLAMTGFAGIP